MLPLRFAYNAVMLPAALLIAGYGHPYIAVVFTFFLL